MDVEIRALVNHCLSRISIAMFAVAVLGYCAIAPANVRRVAQQMSTGDASLHDLLDKAQAAPADYDNAAAALARLVEDWKPGDRARRGDVPRLLRAASPITCNSAALIWTAMVWIPLMSSGRPPTMKSVRSSITSAPVLVHRWRP